MRTSTLLARNLWWYRGANAAVLLGVAAATGVLGGALLVGDSVRASLRDLVQARLGRASYVVTRNGYFGEELATALDGACPLIAIEGVAAHEQGGRRAGNVEVYGVDGRFWKFQGEPGSPPRGNEILLTAALARELGSQPGDTILLRVPKPSAIPLESLHGRKEDAGETIRLAMGGIARREYSLRAQQGDVRAVYLPLARLQRELRQTGRVNTILTGDAPGIERILSQRCALSDLGLKLRVLDREGCLSLESDSAVIGDALAETASATAKALGLRTEPVLTYLANRMRVGAREIPYSVVTALDFAPAPAAGGGITLNEWAARDLEAKPGDPLSLEYYVWKPDGSLHTETAQFQVERVTPIEGAAADPDLAPEYPGITESASLRGWDPPFPLHLSRIRPIDERYWERYRTTPKAFVRLAQGRRLWGTRFGSLTSIRIYPPSVSYAAALRSAIDPARMGLTVVPARANGIEAAQGATDFGEYFAYFSFFLMVSALLLAGLFFRLGVEQRTREIGVLRALGFSLPKIRTVFLLEGAVLAGAGSLAGAAAAPLYGAWILYGLRTWWFDAVGTRLLSLHAAAPSLAWGAAAGVLSGLGAIAWTLRRLQPQTPRGLLGGGRKTAGPRGFALAGTVAALLALAFLAAAWARQLDQTAGFFGAGTLLLAATLLWQSAWLRSRSQGAISGPITLGFRGAAYRPGRSTLCIALIASATFLIVSLDAFRREAPNAGTGGFQLLAESTLPMIHNANTPAGRDALNIPPLPGLEWVPFRLRPGDDASCLNLYRPRNPRILAPPAEFLRGARFAFQGSISETPNPWLLLESPQPGGAIPAIADANSMTYSLHLKLGEDLVLNGVRFRIVAALDDSLFQGELLISEAHFLRLFPEAEGYRFFLLKLPPRQARDAVAALETALSDYGFDIQPASARLENFHRVENAYLSTFRVLGALGLVLGTVGLGGVLLRNVLERRGELALLRAVGYRERHLAVMVLAENTLLLLLGVATGAACALLAVAPAVWLRSGHLPAPSLGALLGAVLACGFAVSLATATAVLRLPLLATLRSE